MKPIYLDYNATTPIAPEVADAMLPYLKGFFGNPSSSHFYGRQSKEAVDKARNQVASLLNCNAGELIFTSGGSESNNYALKGYAFANQAKGKHIITSSIEHPAIIEVCKFLETEGFEVTYLPVDETGRVKLSDVKKAIRKDTILISIMYANNEVGTLQPISEISKLAKGNNIVVHSDCAQAVGKVPVNVQELGVDLLSIAGHKLYGPKGIGALYIREGIKLQKLIHGADHERNLRAGTENVLEIVGLGRAAELAMEDEDIRMRHEKNLIKRLRNNLAQLSDVQFNGNSDFCLPNTLSASFKNLHVNEILKRMKNVAASAGAACHTDSISVLATLEAMHVPIEYAMGTIRFSVGRFTTKTEIDLASNEIIEVVKSLRRDAK
ncbi:cysteine desulfurase family protein [Labilibaculum antarcticum]|uniref:cysteine desulfurase n=1 Tax=Labilibaculum antarcticum TaxID=1717717 RepID=A0A1Y1CKQ4_9BACT|nr:cysteine desulfurase family protein [Labilibaculum antarcticum]BAX80989.1 cysteine desulfurase NifS [Labilibaculum antarcticum]